MKVTIIISKFLDKDNIKISVHSEDVVIVDRGMRIQLEALMDAYKQCNK